MRTRRLQLSKTYKSHSFLRKKRKLFGKNHFFYFSENGSLSNSGKNDNVESGKRAEAQLLIGRPDKIYANISAQITAARTL